MEVRSVFFFPPRTIFLRLMRVGKTNIPGGGEQQTFVFDRTPRRSRIAVMGFNLIGSLVGNSNF
jgi:hypothetical protein